MNNSNNLNEQQAHAVLVLTHKVMSDYEDQLANIRPNDLMKAFNQVAESSEFKDNPAAIAGAWAMFMNVIASTNQDNTEFLEKMHAVMSLS